MIFFSPFPIIVRLSKHNEREGGGTMILAIDTGNTVMTAGLFSPEGTLYFRGAIKSD